MNLYLRENLRRLRKENNYTQQRIADFINIRKNTYANYETGYSSPDYIVVKRLADLFSYSVDQLLFTPLLKSGTERRITSACAEEDLSRKDRGRNTKANLHLFDFQDGDITDLIHFDTRCNLMLSYYDFRLGPAPHINWQVEGDAMSQTVKNGDAVLATFIPLARLPEIKVGNIYLIITTEGVDCKRIGGIVQDSLLLTSDNATYKPYLRKKREVLAFFQVKRVHSSDLGKHIL